LRDEVRERRIAASDLDGSGRIVTHKTPILWFANPETYS